MKIENNQIWISKENPHKSIKITGIGEMYDTTDEGMYCLWTVYDEEAWDRFVLDKKFNGEGDLREHIKNTFPYAFSGECSIKSMKQRIRRDKLDLYKTSIL